MILEQLDPAVTGLGLGHAVTRMLKHRPQCFADRRVIVDHQHFEARPGVHAPASAGVRAALGSEIVARVPPPSRFSSVIVPPCWSTMSRVSERPRPLPRLLVLT